jgi:deoxyribodipyrimidine photo-lyase
MMNVMWFRKDLRLHDNETLLAASGNLDVRRAGSQTQAPTHLLPVFVLPARELAEGRLGAVSLTQSPRRVNATAEDSVSNSHASEDPNSDAPNSESPPFEDPVSESPRMGPFRRYYLQNALNGLRDALHALGSDLYFRIGNAAQTFAEIHAISPISAIYTQELPGTEEESDLDTVEEFCFANGIRLHLFDTHTMLHPDDLPFDVNDMPDIFTPFRGKVEKYAAFRDPLPPPQSLLPLPQSHSQIQQQTPPQSLLPMPQSRPATATISHLEPQFQSDYPSKSQSLVTPPLLTIPGALAPTHPNGALPIDGSEQAALRHLRDYIHVRQLVRTYKETRNGLIGTDYSAKISGWLALGSLSPRTVRAEIAHHEALHGANDSTYWLFFELLWRDYFQFILYKYHQRLFLRGGIPGATNNTPGATDLETFRRWTLGQTGVDFVDANMRELLATGFMSNRGRQNVASWLAKTAGIDWRLGAAWFEQQLLDYDVASNWGNWAYVAGVGTDPRDRTFNIARQADQYDPDHTYRNLWLRQ